AAVHGDDDVERRGHQNRAQVFVVIRIVMQVHHLWWRLDPLVQAAVHDRDLVTPVDEAAYDVDTRRAGTTDDERTHQGRSRFLGFGGKSTVRVVRTVLGFRQLLPARVLERRDAARLPWADRTGVDRA